MPIIINPQNMNPDLGGIVSNLATAIYGNPEARMKAGYYDAETANARANAAKTQAETPGIQAKSQASVGLPSTISAIFAPGPSGETVEQRNARVAPLFGNVAQAGGGNTSEIATGLKSLFSTVYGTSGNDSQGLTSLVLDGKMPTKDTSVSPQMQNASARRDTQNQEAVEFGKARIQEAGANTRFFNTPQKVNPGETINFAPTDPRYKSLGATLFGGPTKATVEGQAGQNIINGDNSETNQGLYTGKLGPSANKARMVSPKSLNGAIALGVSTLDGIADHSTGVPIRDAENSMRNFNDFQTLFTPEQLSGARDAAAQVLATSGDGNAAGKAYIQALGLKPGDHYRKQSLWQGARDFITFSDGPQGSIQPATGAASGAPAPGATRAQPSLASRIFSPPAVTGPEQLPPPAARKVGMTINSPRGRVSWDGRAWQPVLN